MKILQSLLLLPCFLLQYCPEIAAQTPYSVLWQHVYGNSGEDIPKQLIPTSEGYLITGYYCYHCMMHDQLLTPKLVRVNKEGRQLGKFELEMFGSVIQSKIKNDDEIILLMNRRWFTHDKDVYSCFARVTGIDAGGNIKWTKALGNDREDRIAANDVFVLPDGDLIVTGEFEWYIRGGDTLFSKGKTDGWVMRTDALGNEKWFKTFGGSGDDSFQAGMSRQGGEIFIAGHTDSKDGDLLGRPDHNTWLMTLDGEGNKKHESFVMGDAYLDFSPLKENSAGNVVLSGKIAYPENTPWLSLTPWDAFFVETDSGHHPGTLHTFGGSSHDGFNNWIEAEDGYLFAGNSSSADGDLASLTQNGGEGWLVKTTYAGEITSQQFFGGDRSDELTDIIRLENGDLMVLGRTGSLLPIREYQWADRDEMPDDFWLFRLSANSTAVDSRPGQLQLVIQPNPTNGYCKIDFGVAANYFLHVKDLAGKTVLEYSGHGSSAEFEIKSAPGIYFVEISRPGQAGVVLKVIKTAG